MLGKIFKITFLFLVVVLILLIVFAAVFALEWPWWVGLFIILGLIGFGLGITFLRKIWMKSREQNFVQKIIEQDDSALQAMKGVEREQSRELSSRWKEAMDELRRSHLKKHGNPLYVLPWYMVVGESGSGKTTAIESARLSSPFAEVHRTSGISGTRNCDWWFFEQAIILDTAGRYSIPIDEGRDKDEWQKFLGHLIKYRKKEPINGLVVTVSADKLLNSSPAKNEDDGKSIRQRIQELMRVLGAKFPIHVLITKCDLIQGMTEFSDTLPETVLDQAMGVLNHKMNVDTNAFVERSLTTVSERLRDLRLMVVNRSGVSEGTHGLDPGLLLFPEEFDRLKSGLTAFIQGAFQENPYQETPILRGLFFSSGRQEGSPYSHFLNALGLISEREVLPGTNKGIFLHDFFEKILPRDRRLFAPTQKALELNRLTKSLGLASWITVGIALCGMLSFSFVKNIRTLREVSQEFQKPPVLQGEIMSDVIIMDRFRQAIERVAVKNSDWWMPRFGLYESNDVETALKEKYCNKLSENFLQPFDKSMAIRMSHFDQNTTDEVKALNIVHLVRRINLLKTRIEEGNQLETLRQAPKPSYVALLNDPGALPDVYKRFQQIYIYYLFWKNDINGLNQEMNNLQNWLKHLLTQKDSNLKWLVAWENMDEDVPGYNLKQFWGGSIDKNPGILIQPAYTTQGKVKIDTLVAELDKALFDPLIVSGQKEDFKGWYKNTYQGAWFDFGSNFSKGAERLKDREEWQQTAAVISNDEGPYWSLLSKMAKELAPVENTPAGLPPWITLINKFKTVRIQAKSVGVTESKGLMGKVAQKGKSIISNLASKSGVDVNPEDLKLQYKSAEAFKKHQDALHALKMVSVSQAEAFNLTSQAFKEDAASGKSPFLIAERELKSMKLAMPNTGDGSDMFWHLAGGPLKFLWHFAVKESSCHLESRWESEVLAEVHGVGDLSQRDQLLMGDDGFAKKFVKGPAQPFLGRSRKKGYFAKELFGEQVAFKSSFLHYITKGAIPRPVKASYTVGIRGLPTDTNQDAQIKPHETRLEVQCADDIQSLVNVNYPVRKNFKWSPRNCGDVTLSIDVGDMALVKRYTGYRAFAKFLKAFSRGEHKFYSREFPREQANLKRVGIHYITVKYRLSGHRPVIKLLKFAPQRAPEEIVACWDQ